MPWREKTAGCGLSWQVLTIAPHFLFPADVRWHFLFFCTYGLTGLLWT